MAIKSLIVQARACKYQTRVEVTDSDEHSSLLLKRNLKKGLWYWIREKIWTLLIRFLSKKSYKNEKKSIRIQFFRKIKEIQSLNAHNSLEARVEFVEQKLVLSCSFKGVTKFIIVTGLVTLCCFMSDLGVEQTGLWGLSNTTKRGKIHRNLCD